MIRFFTFLIFVLTGNIFAQNLHYQPVPNFFQPPSDGNIIQPTGVAINSKGHIFVFNKGNRQLMEFDARGQYLRSIGAGIFKDPHGLRIDDEDNIWTTDLESHLVLKLSPAGRVLMVLGQNGTSGLYDSVRNKVLFFKPADIAFSENGDIYVADGYGNARVVRLDKDGNLIRTWGEMGEKQGDFNNPHNIVFGPQNRIYVADRNNSRLQVFNREGDFIASWNHLGKPWGLALSSDNQIFMTDGDAEKILRINADGVITGVIDCGPGSLHGQMHAAHGIAVDDRDAVYVTEVLNWRVQKFAPVPATSGSWENMQTVNLPKKRSENAFVEVDGKFYLLGGRGLLRMDVYDPVTQTWGQAADLPMEMHHFQAVNYKGELYVLGALTGPFPYEKPLENVHIYNPKKNEWRLGPAVPKNRRRGAAGAVVYNDKIYMVAGIQNGHWDGHVAWMDEFDPASGKWKKLDDAPRARDHFQVAVIDGKMYAAGGRNTSQKTNQSFQLTIDEVDVYDFEKGKWSTLDKGIPTERAGSTSLSINGKLLVLGGESGNQITAHTEVEVYDPEKGTWSAWDKMNQSRHGMQAVYYQGRIYICGGAGNRGGGPELNRLDFIQVE